MKNLEKQIEDASYSYISGFYENKDKRSIGEAFRKGAKSSEAKEYWQQGMYSEEEVWKILNKYLDYQEHGLDEMTVKEWFELNKKK